VMLKLKLTLSHAISFSIAITLSIEMVNSFFVAVVSKPST
jgi:hypothetical protein